MRRARIEVISDILLFVKKCNEAKPTNILYRANLSVPMLNRYLSALQADALIEKRAGGRKYVYKITEKGRRFIKLLLELDSMTTSIQIYSSKRK